MRASTWRKFSHHQPDLFTVVGVFESPTTARYAAQALSRLFKCLGDWSPPPARAARPPLDEGQTTIRRGIGWDDALEGLAYAGGRGPIAVFENLVFLDGDERGLGVLPADQLIERLGGQALVDGSLSPTLGGPPAVAEVLFFVTCLAPSATEARRIQAEAQSQMQAARYAEAWFTPEVRQHGRRLNFEGVSFPEAPKGIAALCHYLASQGCTDIETMPVEVQRLATD